MTHVRVWKFRPPPGAEREFAAAYAPDGRWEELFGRAPGFLGTTLLAPCEQGGWWMTLDRWESAAHFEAFRAAQGEEYRALDRELEGIVGEEQFVGTFEEASR